MSEIKDIHEAIKEMQSLYDLSVELLDSRISESYHFDLSIKDLCKQNTYKELEELPFETICSYVKKTEEQDEMESLTETYEKMEENKPETLEAYIRSLVKDVRSELLDMEDMREKKDALESEEMENLTKHSAYMAKRRLKNVEKLKSLVETEEDETKKKEMQKKLDAVEAADCLSFLTERLDKYGKKETDSIVDTFFDKVRSDMIHNKFNSRAKRYGFNDEIIKVYLNLEELFLPEEYHDLNNLFLFHVMRYISYSDDSNKVDVLYVNSILTKLYNLRYHKFVDVESEKAFIEVIRKIDDYFMPYKEKLAKYNKTSPNHPYRKESEEKAEQKRRMMIIASLENMGAEVDSTQDTEVLRAQLNELLKKPAIKLEPVEEGEDVMDEAMTIDLDDDVEMVVEEDVVEEITEEETVEEVVPENGAYGVLDSMTIEKGTRYEDEEVTDDTEDEECDDEVEDNSESDTDADGDEKEEVTPVEEPTDLRNFDNIEAVLQQNGVDEMDKLGDDISASLDDIRSSIYPDMKTE